MDTVPEKLSWKPGTMIYPLPAVMVSCGASPEEYNIVTCYISLRPERLSYGIISRTGEFVINLTTKALARATDWCGVRSGREHDKFAEMGLTPVASRAVQAPAIAEAPVSIECRVRQVLPLGSHDMFLADVVNVLVDARYVDERSGRLDLERAGMMAYCHGEYFRLGDVIGHFGWSVRKRKKRPSRAK